MLEQDVVVPANTIFYKRFVDDSINRRKKNQPDELFEMLSSYHQNIKFTMEIASTKFLDTQINYDTPTIETTVYRSDNKLPVHRSSRIPKRYKRNAVNADLHRAEKISSNFELERDVITKKHQNIQHVRRVQT